MGLKVSALTFALPLSIKFSKKLHIRLAKIAKDLLSAMVLNKYFNNAQDNLIKKEKKINLILFLS